MFLVSASHMSSRSAAFIQPLFAATRSSTILGTIKYILIGTCITLVASFTLTLADTTPAVPEPLVATWVSLSVTSASSAPYPSFPSPRCDHGMINLSGRSQRKDDEVAFPGTATSVSTSSSAPPSTDPYASQLLVHGGHEDADYSDSWLLRLVSADSAEWKFVPDPTKDYVAAATAAGPDGSSTAIYSEIVSDSSPARFGFGFELVPNGLSGSAPSETGLTAIMFGGYNNDQYLGDVMSLHLGTGRTRTLVPSMAAASNNAPFARGYLEWSSMPHGSGSGQNGLIDGTTDSGKLYLVGGLGASSGERYSPSDMDWNDEWLFDVKSESWTRLDLSSCLMNITSCSDSATFSSFLTRLSNISFPGSPIDFSESIRPSDVLSRVNELQTAIGNSGLNANTFVDTPNACTVSCGKYASTDRLQPPPHEGARQVVLGNNLYLFGGYSCNANGAMTKGGDDCYSNDMWIMSLLTYEWRVISSPDSKSDWFNYWPTKRAYHAIAPIASRGLILVEGGAYQDQSGSYYYYNDVTAFDVTLERFVPLKIYGVPPKVHWSAAVSPAVLGSLGASSGAIAEADSMLLFGGCQGSIYYDQLMALRVGMAIEAKNCYAYGAGTDSASAGDTASFYIQTREVSYASSNSSNWVFGKNATYGTGLAASFSAQLVSIDSSSSSDTSSGSSSSGGLSLVQTKVSEIGGGLYRISYTASRGSEFQLFVYYESNQIPHSPFHVTLAPHVVYSEALSEAVGLGAAMTEKGASATVNIVIKDKFGNSYQDNRFLPTSGQPLNISMGISRSAPLVVADATSSLLDQATYNSYFTPVTMDVTNLNNGQYLAIYDVPSDVASDYYLRVSIDGIDVVGSPFKVEALDSIVLGKGLIIAFWFLSLFCVCFCLFALAFVFKYRAEAVVRSSSPNFLYLLIFGSILSSLSVIFLTYEKEDFGCQGFHSFLTIGLVINMTALLAKSHRVMRIFNAKQLRVQSNLSDSHLMVPTLIVVALIVLLNVLWIGISPTRATKLPSSDQRTSAVLSFHNCSGANGTDWLAAIIAFCGSLLLYGVYVAVQTGHVPQQYNESKVIAASVYNTFFCSIIVVPLMFLIGKNSDFIAGRFVIEALAILWCSILAPVALTIPKLLIVLKVTQVRNIVGAPNIQQPTAMHDDDDSNGCNSPKVVSGNGAPGGRGLPSSKRYSLAVPIDVGGGHARNSSHGSSPMVAFEGNNGFSATSSVASAGGRPPPRPSGGVGGHRNTRSSGGAALAAVVRRTMQDSKQKVTLKTEASNAGEGASPNGTAVASMLSINSSMCDSPTILPSEHVLVSMNQFSMPPNPNAFASPANTPPPVNHTLQDRNNNAANVSLLPDFGSGSPGLSRQTSAASASLGGGESRLGANLGAAQPDETTAVVAFHMPSDDSNVSPTD